jgi:hypothetical protein
VIAAPLAVIFGFFSLVLNAVLALILGYFDLVLVIVPTLIFNPLVVCANRYLPIHTHVILDPPTFTHASLLLRAVVGQLLDDLKDTSVEANSVKQVK